MDSFLDFEAGVPLDYLTRIFDNLEPLLLSQGEIGNPDQAGIQRPE